MHNKSSDEPVEPAELAADAGLEAAYAVLREHGMEPLECVVLVNGRAPDGMRHGATGAGNVEDEGDVLATLLVHAEELAKAMGMPFHIGEVETPGQG